MFKIFINLIASIYFSPVIVFFFFSKNKKLIQRDFYGFVNYSVVTRKMNNRLLTLIHLLVWRKEYRNVLFLRANKFLKYIFRLIYFPQKTLYINVASKNVGGGLLVIHGFSTIINAEKIGNNCQIFQQVTIGNGKGGIPTIGNNVKIYAGAIIIGKIKIGDNCIIGAGTVVNKDVPDNTICVGPAFKTLPNNI